MPARHVPAADREGVQAVGESQDGKVEDRPALSNPLDQTTLSKVSSTALMPLWESRISPWMTMAPAFCTVPSEGVLMTSSGTIGSSMPMTEMLKSKERLLMVSLRMVMKACNSSLRRGLLLPSFSQ